MARNEEYEQLWAQHQKLRSNEQHAADEMLESLGERDAARQKLREPESGASREDRQDMQEQLVAAETRLEEKSGQYAAAQDATAQLQLQNPQYAQALEDNVPPPESFKEKMQPYVDTATNHAMAGAVALNTMGVDVPHVGNQEIVRNPAVQELEVPDRTPGDKGRQLQQGFRDGMKETEDVNRAVDNAPRSDTAGAGPGPEIASATYEGGASFARQPSHGDTAFPHREAANDNEPREPQATRGIADSKFAGEFQAPPPPPPPPPRPPEEEHSLKP